MPKPGRVVLLFLPWLAATIVLAVPAADAGIVYANNPTVCVSVRVASPSEGTAQDQTVCGASIAGFGATRQVNAFGMTARAEQSTNGSPLAESLSFNSTGKAMMTVGTIAPGAGGYAISQIGFLFTTDGGRPFTMQGSITNGVGNSSFIRLSNLDGTQIFLCNASGPCNRSGALAPGDYLFFMNAEQRANSGGTNLGPETSYELHLNVGAATLPTPTPTATPPVIRWTNPDGGNFDDAGNWDPAQVPTFDDDHEDNALFDLDGAYGVTVANAHANRFLIRGSSVDLGGGSAEVSSTSAPSLSIGPDGKLHLVSGTFQSVDGVLGDSSGGLAEVDLVSGTPTWTNSGRLSVGDAGPGRLTVVAGEVTSGEARIGGGLLGPGAAIVGAPGKWTTGTLGLGLGGGPGTLEIKDGGDVASHDATIGVVFGSGNGVTVTGANPNDTNDASSWDLTGELVVAADGAGSLVVEESAVVGCASMVVGGGVQGVGDATVTGTANGFASTLKVDNALSVGIEGVGTLVVEDGAAASAADVIVGSKAAGTLTVDDARMTVTNAIVVGGSSGLDARPNADGTLRIEASASVTADRLAIGVNPQSDGHVLVRGQSSALELTTLLRVGGDGAADVTIEDGAFLALGDTAEVAISTPILGTPVQLPGTMTLRGVDALGTGSELDTKGSVEVGGGGSVTVTDGAITRAGIFGIGRGGNGTWRVGGGTHTSTSTVDGLFVLGVFEGTGRLTITKGGRVFAKSGLTIGSLSDGVALLDARSAGQTGLTQPLLNVTGALEIGAGAPGAVVLDGGALTATGNATIHPLGVLTGNGQVTAAILNDGGCFAVTPAPSASAGCALPAALGRIAPLVTPPAARAGHLAFARSTRASAEPTLVVDGSLVSQGDAATRIELDGSGGGLRVTGDATLAGTLTVVFRDGFVPRDGDAFPLLDVLGTTTGAFASTIVTGLPPGWDGEVTTAGGSVALTVFGDYLCYQTAAAKGGKFPKDVVGTLTTPGGALDFGVKKPTLLCNPSGPSTGSRQNAATQLRGYLVTDASADPLAIASRTLRVTNGLHPNGELVVDTKATTLALASAEKCVDEPTGTCPTDLAAPADGDAFVCALAKRSKAGAAFPKGLTASAVDAFGEPRTYALGKPTRVCAPTTGALQHALACYAAKPLGKVCVLDAPANAAAPCKSELDCGGTKKVTSLCAKQTKHAKRTSLVLATSIARDRASTTKPVELCVPSTLAAP